MTSSQAMSLVGTSDSNLETLCDCFGKEISFRDNTFTIRDCSDAVYEQIHDVLLALYEIARKNQPVSRQDVIYACRLVTKNEKVSFNEFGNEIIGRTLTGRAIAPKTKGQYAFVKAMDSHSITFAIGPAGTGKTFLAVIKAVTALKKGDVKRIVLTRPAVEAGESLGFLPGDMKEKVDPYLTPLYDALHDMLGVEKTENLIERGVIEIAPLAYMRGRTLEDAFIILDEAQNTTAEQMRMALTRFGFGSRLVVTGDATQIDLPAGKQSGLTNAAMVLKDIPGIGIVHFTERDVIRHEIVAAIIKAYQKYDDLQKKEKKERREERHDRHTGKQSRRS
ncbi:MAG TPA: PhoH family protein [Erysipelotrichaceae bacterium]|nr:PhoH family protein [Erysipelotrichaceae bacterium]